MAAIAHGFLEVQLGSSMAVAGLAGGSAGASTLSAAGVLLLGHGAVAAATADLAWVTAELIKLEAKPKVSSRLLSTNNEHHIDPVFMGGDKKHPTTTIKESKHHSLHKDLNKFLLKYKNKIGKDMSPRRMQRWTKN